MHPMSLRLYCEELAKVVDDYWAGKLDEKSLKKHLKHYQKEFQRFGEGDFTENLTVKRLCGKKRVNAIKMILSE